METKQTAVNWLTEQIKSDQKQKALSTSEWMQVIDQAKQMEKEQMFDYIKKNYVNGEHSLKFHKEEFEQYYNETYGKETDRYDTKRKS